MSATYSLCCPKLEVSLELQSIVMLNRQFFMFLYLQQRGKGHNNTGLIILIFYSLAR